jgi:hypothetical protein
MEKGCIERAYELARSGRFDSVTAVKKQLKAEGYNANQEIGGGSLIGSLSETLRAARGHQPRQPAAPRPLLSSEQRAASAKRGAALRSALRAAERRGA